MNPESRDQFITDSSVTDFLRSPVLENLKLEDPATSSVSESSENEEDHNKQQQNKTKNQTNKTKADHQESPHEPPDLETQEKLLKQLEYYFSDENIIKDQFLLKHVRQNKAGYVSLKLLATFKRVQKLSKDWRDLRYVLSRQADLMGKNGVELASDDHKDKGSPALALNTNGTKVRRVKILSDSDDAVQDRTIVVFNYQTILKAEASPVESITDYFSGTKQDSSNEGRSTNEVVLVRLTTPGSKLPDDLKSFHKLNQGIANKPCALVEFKTVEMAQGALLKFNGQNDWRGLQVLPLKPPEKKRQTADDHIKSQPKKFAKNKQHATMPFAIKSADFSTGASAESLTGSGSPKMNRSRAQHQPQASPHAQHGTHRAARNWESGRSQADRNPCASLTISHLTDHSPRSGPSSLDNCSGSPWLRKKMLPVSNGDLATGQREVNRITVVRQPRGPDGSSKGFCKSSN